MENSSTIVARPLDLRGVGAAQVLSRLLSQFDRLRPGEVLQLSSDRDLGAVLRYLECERPNLFDWRALESSGGGARADISRRLHGRSLRQAHRPAQGALENA